MNKRITTICITCFISFWFWYSYTIEWLIGEWVDSFIKSWITIKWDDVRDVLYLFEWYRIEDYDYNNVEHQRIQREINQVLVWIWASLIQQWIIDISDLWKIHEDQNLWISFYLPFDGSFIFDWAQETTTTYFDEYKTLIVHDESEYYSGNNLLTEMYWSSLYQQYFRVIKWNSLEQITNEVDLYHRDPYIYQNCSYQIQSVENSALSDMVEIYLTAEPQNWERRESDDPCWNLYWRTIYRNEELWKAIESNYWSAWFTQTYREYLRSTVNFL